MATFQVSASVREMDWTADRAKAESGLRSMFAVESQLAGKTVTSPMDITVGALDEATQARALTLTATVA